MSKERKRKKNLQGFLTRERLGRRFFRFVSSRAAPRVRDSNRSERKRSNVAPNEKRFRASKFPPPTQPATGPCTAIDRDATLQAPRRGRQGERGSGDFRARQQKGKQLRAFEHAKVKRIKMKEKQKKNSQHQKKKTHPSPAAPRRQTCRSRPRARRPSRARRGHPCGPSRRPPGRPPSAEGAAAAAASSSLSSTTTSSSKD